MWWLVCVALITALLCAPFFRVVYGMADEGAILRGAELMLRGKKLYADFFEFLPPATYLLTTAWFALAGLSIASARTLAILTVVGIACFTFLSSRQASKDAPLSAVLVCSWAMMSQWQWLQVSHHWFTTFFSMLAAWAALASLGQSQPRSSLWPVVAGLASGAAITTMQTCGLWVALATIIAFRTRSELLAYVLGLALIPAIVILYLVEQNTLAAAFDDVVIFAATQYASIQSVPFGYGTSTLDYPISYLFPLVAFLAIFIGISDWRTHLREHRFQLCIALALAGLVGCFPRPDVVHIGFGAPLALPLLAYCAGPLVRRLSPPYRRAAIAATVVFYLPPVVAYVNLSNNAFHARAVPTPRGDTIFASNQDMSKIIGRIAAIPPGESFFFYPFMPLLPFLTAREHVSKYDLFVPWYTTPAQYQSACQSLVREATWVVLDRRFRDNSYWKGAYPAIPDAEPRETIQFEKALKSAFAPVVTEGDFDLRRRRPGISDDLCHGINPPEDTQQLGARHSSKDQ